MSTLGHSGQSGHGGHGGQGGHAGQGPGHHGNHGHGHHGHSGGNAMGGGGQQQTWASIFNETRFSGDGFRSPLFGLIAYGMVFLSIVLVICLADNNLLDFAVTQHRESQQKHAREVAEAETKAEEEALKKAGATQPQSDAQPAAQQGFDQQAAAPQDNGQQSLLPPVQPLPSVAQPGVSQQPSQPGYLQQSLLQQMQPGYSQQGYAPQAYAAPSQYQQAAAPGFPQGGFQQGFGGPMQPPGFAPAQNAGAGYPQRTGAYQHSGAYYQGGYKTGPDGTTQVPMNRMVVNR